jgi:NAD-dependent DNA ligase
MGNIDNVSQFVRQAKSQTAVHYYINNPDKVYSELRLNPMFAKNLVDWFSDGRHAETFDSIIHNQNIEIVEVQKKFKGDPIFINKKICIAGKFQHGSLEEITSILNSYSADVTLELTSDCSCLVVGHFRGEPKQIIDLAQSYNIPVYVEDEFFSSFQIDNDLEKLHLI